MNPVEIIQRKKRGESLSKQELQQFISGYLSGSVEEYQLSAFLMAVYFQGMSAEETLALTEVMRDSGKVLSFSHPDKVFVDKHSTGGVGDKTSLILAPLVAAAGVSVPMMAGRGLAHTGGTLDKLESIPGFSVSLSLDQFVAHIEQHGFCIIGQTKEICPADKRIYALRDVTATVDSLPLICASIMSKKLAEGIQALVLDVKTGSGAFMKTPEAAEELATNLIEIGRSAGLKVTALITSMNQVLGSFVGNALEVQECIEIMQGRSKTNESGLDLYEDTRELTLKLAAEMIVMGKKAATSDEGYHIAQEILSSGKALEKFYEMCKFQGPSKPNELQKSANVYSLKSDVHGYVSAMDVEGVGRAAVELGAGRLKASDKVDPKVGFEFLVKIGSFVEKGQELVRIHYENEDKLSQTKALLVESLKIIANQPFPDKLILKKL